MLDVQERIYESLGSSFYRKRATGEIFLHTYNSDGEEIFQLVHLKYDEPVEESIDAEVIYEPTTEHLRAIPASTYALARYQKPPVAFGLNMPTIMTIAGVVVGSIIILNIFANHAGIPIIKAAPIVPKSISAPVSQSSSVSRVWQMDSSLYNSTEQHNLYAASACSTASMYEVLRSYGAQVTLGQVLDAEISEHAISADSGLLDEPGIARTVAHFGFHASIDHTHTLSQVVTLANNHTPVIVSIPPGRTATFRNGHILVLIGGDDKYVALADSSGVNISRMDRQIFQYEWSGLSAIVTPNQVARPVNVSYQQMAIDDARAAGIDSTLFVRQIQQESGFQTDRTSPVGAVGIAQFMPETARGLGINPNDPVVSLRAAAHLMAGYLRIHGGDWAKALSCYNAGSGATYRAIVAYGSDWLANMPAETRGYVHVILNQ